MIRPYRQDDRVELVRLWESVFPDDPPWNAPESLIDEKLRVQPACLLVAETEDGIVGAVMGGYDGVRGWLYHLAVDDRFRRQGIGTALVRGAERCLADAGCAKINLQIRSANHDVEAFYRSLGYAVEDRISMGRRLDAER